MVGFGTVSTEDRHGLIAAPTEIFRARPNDLQNSFFGLAHFFLAFPLIFPQRFPPHCPGGELGDATFSGATRGDGRQCCWSLVCCTSFLPVLVSSTGPHANLFTAQEFAIHRLLPMAFCRHDVWGSTLRSIIESPMSSRRICRGPSSRP